MIKLFGKYKRDSHNREYIENIPDPQIEPMKILITSKGSVDIVYKGKKARFYGELGISDFRAVTGSMRWMEPVKDAPVSEEEREEWLNAIMNHPENNRTRVCFVDDREDDLKRAEDYWNKKEYKKAKVLFEKHFDSLTQIQIKKLEYIKKHYSCF